MGNERRSLDQLHDLGWTIDQGRGVTLPGFVSVSLCLIRDGHTIVCVPGFGNTRLQALDDVARKANAWIARELVDDPGPLFRSNRLDNRYRPSSDVSPIDEA